MKSIIKITLLSLVMILLTSGLYAQTKGQKKKAIELSSQLQTALDLDNQLSTKIYDLYIDTFVEMRQVKTATDKGFITKKEEKIIQQKLWKTNKEKIEEVLGYDLTKEYRIYIRKAREEKTKVRAKGASKG